MAKERTPTTSKRASGPQRVARPANHTESAEAKTIREVMSTQLLWVAGQTNLLTVSQVMAQRDVGSILVKSGDEIVGIITEKDVVRKVVAKELVPTSVTAEAIMSYPVASVEQDLTLSEARQLMAEQNIRHLLVTDNGRPVGMISVRTWLETPE